jgi:hypothetical protein
VRWLLKSRGINSLGVTPPPSPTLNEENTTQCVVLKSPGVTRMSGTSRSTGLHVRQRYFSYIII